MYVKFSSLGTPKTRLLAAQEVVTTSNYRRRPDRKKRSKGCSRDSKPSPRRRPSIVHSSGRMSPSRDSCSSCPGLEALSPGRELILAVDRTYCIHRRTYCIHRE
uniref:Uncharacterized protein n=1 Tax=Cacopsylla melanoneura TaxID=428564 RepID=A0A8D8YTU0_9HEMI